MMAPITQGKTFWAVSPFMGLAHWVLARDGSGTSRWACSDFFLGFLKRFSLCLDFYGCSGITYAVSGNVTNTIAQETPWTWFSWR